MRCSGSPTTCTAAELGERERAVRSVAASLLFRELLKPLAAGLGPAAEIVCGRVADRLGGERR